MANPVPIPLLNTNEPEAMLAAIHVQNGQPVAVGDPLCTLETTKSTADVEAESAGYIAGLHHQVGQTVQAGEIFCYLAETPDWKAQPEPAMPGQATDLPPELRISEPALALAREKGVDLTQLPAGKLITRKDIQELLGHRTKPSVDQPMAGFDPMRVILYGGGGHGKALIDLLRAMGTYRIAGIIDDGMPVGDVVMGVPVLGGHAKLEQLFAQGTRLAVNAVGGIGNIRTREGVFRRLAAAGYACPTLRHPRATVEPSATLAGGVQVFPLAYIGSEARVGYGAIINTGAIISHDCQLGEIVNISPGAILAGEVQVGRGTLIGMGVTINLQVKIGENCRIGNGATVKEDVPSGGVVRAGSIWPR